MSSLCEGGGDKATLEEALSRRHGEAPPVRFRRASPQAWGPSRSAGAPGHIPVLFY